MYIVGEEGGNDRHHRISHIFAKLVLSQDFSQAVAEAIAIHSVATNPAYRRAPSGSACSEMFLNPSFLCRCKLQHERRNEVESNDLHEVHPRRYGYDVASGAGLQISVLIVIFMTVGKCFNQPGTYTVGKIELYE